MKRAVFRFLAVSFGVSWAVWTPLVLDLSLPPWYYYLGALGPALGTLAALGASRERGSLGMWIRLRLGRLGRPRAWGGMAGGFALCLALALGWELGASGSLASLEGLGTTSELPGWTPLAVLALLSASYGLCEELGWRGWLFPTWSRAWGPQKAALAVGGVWCLWHLPAFFCNPTYQAMGWTTAFWILSLLAGSVLLSWLMLESGGSLWPVVAWHSLFDFLTVSDSSGPLLAPVLSMAVLVLAPVAWRRLGR